LRTILVHFDVSDNQVRLETFIKSAKAAQKSVQAVNNAYFGGEFVFEIVVLAPEAGSLKQFIGITWKAAQGAGYAYAILWSAIQMLDSQSVQDISRELYGKEPTEMIIDKINRIKEAREDGSVSEETLAMEAQQLVEELVTRSATSGLEFEPLKLRKSKIPDNTKYEFSQAQSDLFSGALADPDISGIGFSEEEEFPVPRNKFAERAVPPVRPEEEEDEEYIMSTRDILVTSPQFYREDQATRKWKGRDVSGSFVLFEITDEEFWQKLKNREIDFGEDTVLKLQIATLKSARGRPTHKAIRVLAVDDEQIASPLSDDAVAAIIGSFSAAQYENDVLDLF